MNGAQKDRLEDELKVAGASSAELGSLVNIAEKLNELKTTEVPSYVRVNQRAKRIRSILAIGIPSVLSLATGMFVVISSQTVLPGSTLYPVQKLSDNIAASIEPAYRATLMMKRAHQVRELVHNRAPSNSVLATLADYQKEAASYKSTTSNYAAFEYCKHDLQEAATIAPVPERRAITTTLESLSNV